MKIRADFVTNSSSTSFVVITRSGFGEEEFLKMAGVANGSPWEPAFKRLHEVLRERMTSIGSYRYDDYRGYASMDDFITRKFGTDVLAQVKAAQAAGRAVYLGDLESAGEPIESLFCVESFELKSDEIYVNALECGW